MDCLLWWSTRDNIHFRVPHHNNSQNVYRTLQESGSIPCVEAKYEQPWLGEGSVRNAMCSEDHIQMNAELPLGLVLQLA